MGGGSGGGDTTTVTKSDPWSGQQPYLQQGMAAAQTNYAAGGPQYYQGSTVAPQSTNTQNAYGMVANQVNNNPLQGAATNTTMDTLNGKYLDPSTNPYLAGTFKAGSDQVTTAYNNAVNGQTAGFEAGGRLGSGMQAFNKNQADTTLANSLGNLEATTYGQNYTNERANQLGAINSAGAVQNQGLTNANALGSVGSAQDQYAQNLTNADVNKWNYNQNLPNNTLAQYMGLIQGNYGGSSSTQTPLVGQSLLGNLLGGTALAAGAYNQFGSSSGA